MKRPDARTEKAQADGAGEAGNSISRGGLADGNVGESESRSNNELQEVSRSQARTWTLKYREKGESGLEDRRGKRKHEQEPRSELEQMQIRIAQLEHQLYIAEMENHLLKN